jgi:membrane protein
MARWIAGIRRSVSEKPIVRTVLDVYQRVNELGGGALASAVTLALFLSLFPILLLAIAVLGFRSANDDELAARLVADLGLTGDAAEFVVSGLAAAENSRAATSIVGIIGLVWAALGVVSTMQHLCDRAWQLSGRGVRDKLLALVWLAGAFVLLGGSTALAGLVPALPGWAAPAEVIGSIALGTGFFLWTFKINTAKALPLRAHLPGSLAGGVGFHLLTLVGAWLVPGQASSSSALYGSIGVVFAVLAWLLLVGRLFIYSVCLNVVLWEREHGTVRVEVAAPRFDGEVPLAANRSGVVVPR